MYGDTMNVVVVESDRELLAYVQLVLLADKHDVLLFLAGAPAIVKLQAGQADVLVCDLGLPDMDGEVVARAAKMLPRVPRIVLMSGDPARLERARPLADAVLPKPFRPRQLLDVLASLPHSMPH
jgi:DNA-binding response OmpR family regulator